MTAKTALFIVAEGSEELELVAPVDILRRANVTLLLVFMYYTFYSTIDCFVSSGKNK